VGNIQLINMVEKLIKEEINRNIYTDWEIFAAIKIVADIRTEVVKNGGRWLDDDTGNSALPLADKKPVRYRCLLCGRDKFTRKIPHNCNGGFRKRNIQWEPIYE